VIFLGIGLLLLYKVYAGVDGKKMMDDLKDANLFIVALTFVMGMLAIISRGLRWLIVIKPLGYEAKALNSVNSVAFAYFANTFVPRSGEIARCGALNQTDNIPIDKLFGTVISERVVDFVMLSIFLGIAFITNVDEFNRLLENVAVGDGSGVATLLMYAGIGFGILIVLFFIFRKKIITSGFYKKIVGFVLGVKEGFKSILKMKQKWAFVAHTIFIWLMYFLMAYAVFFALPSIGGIDLDKALFVVVAGGLGMVFPAPGGVGSYHYAVMLGFLALNMPEEDGRNFATIVWTTQTSMIILFGAVAFGLLALAKIKNQKAKENAASE
jgi:uncharacterized protein (TIRG00374 family)